MTDPKRKPSGRNVTESERSTIKVQLRLEPDAAEDLDALASRWRVTRSGAVAQLVERELREIVAGGTLQASDPSTPAKDPER